MDHQGSVEVSTRGGDYASLLVQQLNGHLASADSLWMAVRDRLATILSADKSL